MPWIILSVLMASFQAASSAPKNPACAPPPEWGGNIRYERWSAHRSCTTGMDMLVVEALVNTGEPGGFAFLCDKDGIGGRAVINDPNKIKIGESVSLTVKGSTAPALVLEASGALIELEASPATKRLEAALVEGPGPSFTLVITPRGKPPIEMTFARAGLAAAVKPLRSKCGW